MKISAELRAWRNVDLSINSRGDFTQQEAADFLGVPLKTYIDWEQGRRVPEGPARVLLKVIENDPKAVERALAAA